MSQPIGALHGVAVSDAGLMPAYRPVSLVGSNQAVEWNHIHFIACRHIALLVVQHHHAAHCAMRFARDFVGALLPEPSVPPMLSPGASAWHASMRIRS